MKVKTQELECRLLMATLELSWVKESSWWWGTMEKVAQDINRLGARAKHWVIWEGLLQAGTAL